MSDKKPIVGDSFEDRQKVFVEELISLQARNGVALRSVAQLPGGVELSVPISIVDTQSEQHEPTQNSK